MGQMDELGLLVAFVLMQFAIGWWVASIIPRTDRAIYGGFVISTLLSELSIIEFISIAFINSGQHEHVPLVLQLVGLFFSPGAWLWPLVSLAGYVIGVVVLEHRKLRNWQIDIASLIRLMTIFGIVGAIAHYAR